jgi:SMC interacting uncharacterized protein involved in chromosome segregation
MNSIIKFINFSYKILVDLYKKFNQFLQSLYAHLMFIFNKRKTIKKIYEPIITSKVKENQILISEIKNLKDKNTSLEKDINQLNSYVNNLKVKIDQVEKNFII